MATKELEAALQRQRAGFVTPDALKMLSEILETDVETVVRVAFAYQHMLNVVGILGLDWTQRLPPDLHKAIRHAVEAGALRVVLSQAVEANRTYRLPVDAFLPFDRHREICNGCEIRLECMADNLHQPDHCYCGRHSTVPVQPTHLTKTHVTVKAAQPAGTYVVPLSKIRLPQR